MAQERTKRKILERLQETLILAYDDYLKYDSPPATTTETTYTANQVQQILQDELFTILGSNAPTDPMLSDNPPPLEPAPVTANAAITIDDVRRVIQETLASNTPSQSRSRTTNPSRPPRSQLVAQGLLRGKPVSYCWTHGVTSNLRHQPQPLPTSNLQPQASKSSSPTATQSNQHTVQH